MSMGFFARKRREPEAGATTPDAKTAYAILASVQRVLSAEHHLTIAALEAMRSRPEAPFLTPVVRELQDALEHPTYDPLQMRDAFREAFARDGQHDVACELSCHLLLDYTTTLGQHHPKTMLMRRQAANDLAATGETAEALEHLRDVIADQTQHLPADDPEILSTRHDYVTCLAEAGQLVEAIDEAWSLLARQEIVLAKDHPDAFRTRYMIAELQLLNGADVQSLATARHALSDGQLALGPDHPTVLQMSLGLCRALDAVGASEEAELHLAVLVPQTVSALPEGHPGRLATRRAYGELLLERGRPDLALPVLQQLLLEETTVYGETHRAALATRLDIAACHRMLDATDTARTALTYLMAECESYLGVFDAVTHQAYMAYADLCAATPGSTEDLETIRRYVEKLLHVADPHDRIALMARMSLVLTLDRHGQHDEARIAGWSLLGDLRTELGPDHEVTQRLHHLLQGLS